MLACGQLMREVGHSLGPFNLKCGGGTQCYWEWAPLPPKDGCCPELGHVDPCGPVHGGPDLGKKCVHSLCKVC